MTEPRTVKMDEVSTVFFKGGRPLSAVTFRFILHTETNDSASLTQEAHDQMAGMLRDFAAKLADAFNKLPKDKE